MKFIKSSNKTIPIFNIAYDEAYKSNNINISEIHFNNKFHNIDNSMNRLQFLRKVVCSINESTQTDSKLSTTTVAYNPFINNGNNENEWHLCTLYIEPGRYGSYTDIIDEINRSWSETYNNLFDVNRVILSGYSGVSFDSSKQQNLELTSCSLLDASVIPTYDDTITFICDRGTYIKNNTKYSAAGFVTIPRSNGLTISGAVLKYPNFNNNSFQMVEDDNYTLSGTLAPTGNYLSDLTISTGIISDNEYIDTHIYQWNPSSSGDEVTLSEGSSMIIGSTGNRIKILGENSDGLVAYEGKIMSNSDEYIIGTDVGDNNFFGEDEDMTIFWNSVEKTDTIISNNYATNERFNANSQEGIKTTTIDNSGEDFQIKYGVIVKEVATIEGKTPTITTETLTLNDPSGKTYQIFTEEFYLSSEDNSYYKVINGDEADNTISMTMLGDNFYTSDSSVNDEILIQGLECHKTTNKLLVYKINDTKYLYEDNKFYRIYDRYCVITIDNVEYRALNGVLTIDNVSYQLYGRWLWLNGKRYEVSKFYSDVDGDTYQIINGNTSYKIVDRYQYEYSSGTVDYTFTKDIDKNWVDKHGNIATTTDDSINITIGLDSNNKFMLNDVEFTMKTTTEGSIKYFIGDMDDTENEPQLLNGAVQSYTDYEYYYVVTNNTIKFPYNEEYCNFICESDKITISFPIKDGNKYLLFGKPVNYNGDSICIPHDAVLNSNNFICKYDTLIDNPAAYIDETMYDNKSTEDVTFNMNYYNMNTGVNTYNVSINNANPTWENGQLSIGSATYAAKTEFKYKEATLDGTYNKNGKFIPVGSLLDVEGIEHVDGIELKDASEATHYVYDKLDNPVNIENISSQIGNVDYKIDVNNRLVKIDKFINKSVRFSYNAAITNDDIKCVIYDIPGLYPSFDGEVMIISNIANNPKQIPHCYYEFKPNDLIYKREAVYIDVSTDNTEGLTKYARRIKNNYNRKVKVGTYINSYHPIKVNEGNTIEKKDDYLFVDGRNNRIKKSELDNYLTKNPLSEHKLIIETVNSPGTIHYFLCAHVQSNGKIQIVSIFQHDFSTVTSIHFPTNSINYIYVTATGHELSSQDSTEISSTEIIYGGMINNYSINDLIDMNKDINVTSFTNKIEGYYIIRLPTDCKLSMADNYLYRTSVTRANYDYTIRSSHNHWISINITCDAYENCHFKSTNRDGQVQYYMGYNYNNSSVSSTTITSLWGGEYDSLYLGDNSTSDGCAPLELYHTYTLFSGSDNTFSVEDQSTEKDYNNALFGNDELTEEYIFDISILDGNVTNKYYIFDNTTTTVSYRQLEDDVNKVSMLSTSQYYLYYKYSLVDNMKPYDPDSYNYYISVDTKPFGFIGSIKSNNSIIIDSDKVLNLDDFPDKLYHNRFINDDNSVVLSRIGTTYRSIEINELTNNTDLIKRLTHIYTEECDYIKFNDNMSFYPITQQYKYIEYKHGQYIKLTPTHQPVGPSNTDIVNYDNKNKVLREGDDYSIYDDSGKLVKTINKFNPMNSSEPIYTLELSIPHLIDSGTTTVTEFTTGNIAIGTYDEDVINIYGLNSKYGFLDCSNPSYNNELMIYSGSNDYTRELSTLSSSRFTVLAEFNYNNIINSSYTESIKSYDSWNHSMVVEGPFYANHNGVKTVSYVIYGYTIIILDLTEAIDLNIIDGSGKLSFDYGITSPPLNTQYGIIVRYHDSETKYWTTTISNLSYASMTNSYSTTIGFTVTLTSNAQPGKTFDSITYNFIGTSDDNINNPYKFLSRNKIQCVEQYTANGVPMTNYVLPPFIQHASYYKGNSGQKAVVSDNLMVSLGLNSYNKYMAVVNYPETTGNYDNTPSSELVTSRQATFYRIGMSSNITDILKRYLNKMTISSKIELNNVENVRTISLNEGVRVFITPNAIQFIDDIPLDDSLSIMKDVNILIERKYLQVNNSSKFSGILDKINSNALIKDNVQTITTVSKIAKRNNELKFDNYFNLSSEKFVTANDLGKNKIELVFNASIIPVVPSSFINYFDGTIENYYEDNTTELMPKVISFENGHYIVNESMMSLYNNKFNLIDKNYHKYNDNPRTTLWDILGIEPCIYDYKDVVKSGKQPIHIIAGRYYTEDLYLGDAFPKHTMRIPSIRKVISNSEGILNNIEYFNKTTHRGIHEINMRVPRKLKLYVYPNETVAEISLNQIDTRDTRALAEYEFDTDIIEGTNACMPISVQLNLDGGQTASLILTSDEQKYLLIPNNDTELFYSRT